MPGSLEAVFTSLLEAPEHARRSIRLAIALGRNRLELFSIEAREESLFLIRILIAAAAAFLCLFLALVLGAITVIYAIGPEHRLTALIVATAFFLVVGVVLALGVRVWGKRARLPFPQTITEMRKDEELL